MSASTIRVGLVRAFATIADDGDGKVDVRTVVDVAAKKIGALNPDHLLTLDYVDGWEERADSLVLPPPGWDQPIALLMANGPRIVSIPMTWTQKTLTLGVSAVTPEAVMVLRDVPRALERFTDFIVDVAADFFGSPDDDA